MVVLVKSRYYAIMGLTQRTLQFVMDALRKMIEIVKIDDLTAKELTIYHQLSEKQLLHYLEPEPGIFIAESPKVIWRALDAGYQPISLLMEEKEIRGGAAQLLDRLDCAPGVKVMVYTGEDSLLTNITGFHLTRGVLCAMRRKELPAVEKICAGASRVVVLENVENPTNVGAIFRSAAAMFIDAVLLTKGCSDPLYRRAARVSMGNVFQVPWTFIPEEDWPERTLGWLRKLGFTSVSLALTGHSVPVDDPALKRDRLVILLGTEGDGLRPQTIAETDYTVKIPMNRGVDSLNVAAASAVAFWELRPSDK